jgi:hypothetical protein
METNGGCGLQSKKPSGCRTEADPEISGTRLTIGSEADELPVARKIFRNIRDSEILNEDSEQSLVEAVGETEFPAEFLCIDFGSLWQREDRVSDTSDDFKMAAVAGRHLRWLS